MSFKTWINYGYGICTDDLPLNNDNLEELMSRAPIFLEECNRWLEENRGVDCPRGLDYFDAEDIDYGIATILAEVILEAEGLYFTACDDFDGKTYLIYQPCYPWEMNERDSVMTEEKIADILREYVGILTDSPIEIGHHDVENGG